MITIGFAFWGGYADTEKRGLRDARGPVGPLWFCIGLICVVELVRKVDRFISYLGL